MMDVDGKVGRNWELSLKQNMQSSFSPGGQDRRPGHWICGTCWTGSFCCTPRQSSTRSVLCQEARLARWCRTFYIFLLNYKNQCSWGRKVERAIVSITPVNQKQARSIPIIHFLLARLVACELVCFVCTKYCTNFETFSHYTPNDAFQVEMAVRYQRRRMSFIIQPWGSFVDQ